MDIRNVGRILVVVLSGALAGCATLTERPPVDVTGEQTVYFEGRDGTFSKAATVLSQPADRRVLVFSRSSEANRIVVCAEQPDDGGDELIRAAFFQNCLARANGLIDDRQFGRAHESLIDAVAKRLGAAAAK